MRLLPTIFHAARAQRPLLAALGLLVFVTSFLAAAAPPALTGRYDQALRDMAVDRGGEAGPDLVLDGAVTLVRQDGPRTDAQLQEINQFWPNLVPAPLRATTTGPSTYNVRTPRLTIIPPPGRPRRISGLTLTWDPGIAPRIRYVSGRPPANVLGNTARPRTGPAPTIEVALAAQAAELLRLRVGDVVPLGDRDFLRSPAVRISGLYAPVSATDPFWATRPQSLTAQDVDIGEGVFMRLSTATLDAAGYAALYRDTDVSLRYTWRLPVDPGRLTAAAAPALSADVSELRFTVRSRTNLQLVTGLDTVLSTFTAQLRVTQSILALALGGLGTVALCVLVLGLRLLLERMRTALATMRARGGSLAQLCGLACGTVALVAAPATAAGYALAAVAPGPPAALSPAGAVLAAALLVPCVEVVTAHRRPGRDERHRLTEAPAEPRRLVLEGLVVTLALVGTVVLRQRGLTTESAELGTDPFVAAVPVLLALATGLLVLRGYPYPLRAVGRIVRRGRSTVPFVGIALASRQRLVAILPMVVLLLATAVTGFASTVDAGVHRAQVSSAWHSVGADAHVSAPLLDPGAVGRVKRVKGVEDAIPAVVMASARLTAAGALPETVSVIAVDLDAYRRIVAGRPVHAPPAPRGGAAEVPALFSPSLAGMAAAGGTSVSWSEGTLPIRPAGTIDDFPTRPVGIGFVVIPYSALDPADAIPNTIFVRGTDLDAGLVQRAAGAGAGAESGVLADTYTRVHDELTGAPLVSMVHDTFRYAALAAGGYGFLTILLTLITGAAARGRTVSYLRMLGLSRGQTRRLALLELGPMILCAALSGWAVGLLLPHIVGPAVDLRAYTGGFPAADFRPGLASTALLAGGLIVSVWLAPAIETLLDRRPSGTRRMGDEP
ncbi:MAG: FtsX-like permease family protein [Actinomadura sp.]